MVYNSIYLYYVSLNLKGEDILKILQSKKSIVTVALLTLLSLNGFLAMTTFVNADPTTKDPTVYVNGDGSVELTWKSGKSQTYSYNTYVKLAGLDTITIIPSPGWHIDAVLIDGNPQGILDEDGYSLIDVQAKSMISINFVENGGIDDVDTGSNVAAYPDPDVGLIFDNVFAIGFAQAYIIGLQQTGQIGESWDIYTNATFNQNVTVYLVCQVDDLPDGVDPYDLALWRTEVVLGDVNLDGVVDGTDQSIVANANPDDPADPNLDLNDDGVVDDQDVTIVSHNHGEVSVWEPLQSWVLVDGDFVYVYGLTDQFSVFGVTRIHR